METTHILRHPLLAQSCNRDYLDRAERMKELIEHLCLTRLALYKNRIAITK